MPRFTMPRSTMPRSIRWLLVLAFAGASFTCSTGCSTARNPSRGFRLAANGDNERGKKAFQEFGCTECHEVNGAHLPSPTLQHVKLGGPVTSQFSDGYLVTAIINPKFHATHYAAADGAQSGNPNMPEFASRMTVQQLTDIVTYLQSRYSIFPMQKPSEYP